MLCSSDISKILSEFISGKSGKNSNTKNGSGDDNCSFNLAPSELLIIGGILADVLEVESVLVDKDQKVEIILSGSLKRKTELDKMLDDIGTMPFDDVLQALINRAK